MANEPDYSEIQSLWVQTWQERPTLETVKAEIAAADKAADDVAKILETARPTFKKANPGLWVDLANLRGRLDYYRSMIDGDASVFPAINHAMLFGSDHLEEFGPMLPDGAIASLEAMKIAPKRGDLSAATGVLYVTSEGMDGWLQSVWDSWLLATLVGYPAEVLTDAGYEVDHEVWIRELTGRDRNERRRDAWETAGVVLGVGASVVGIALAVRQWRRGR